MYVWSMWHVEYKVLTWNTNVNWEKEREGGETGDLRESEKFPNISREMLTRESGR